MATIVRIALPFDASERDMDALYLALWDFFREDTDYGHDILDKMVITADVDGYDFFEEEPPETGQMELPFDSEEDIYDTVWEGSSDEERKQ